MPNPTALGPRWARLLFWTLAAVIAYSTLCPIELRPKTGHVLGERFAAYLLLGAAAALARPRTPLRDFLKVAAIAAILEAAQLLVPGRDGHVIDALQKIAGGASGVLIVVLGRALAAISRSRPAREREAAGEPTP